MNWHIQLRYSLGVWIVVAWYLLGKSLLHELFQRRGEMTLNQNLASLKITVWEVTKI
jgi:hypothetical protein